MSKGKVLIVDDENDVVQFMSANLRMEGYDVVTAYDGLGALDSTFDEMPDIVLLDIMMPVMSGYEVCQQLKANPTTKSIPIVLVSSAYSTSSVMQGRQVGANGYLSKPFTPAELLAQVQTLIGNSK